MSTATKGQSDGNARQSPRMRPGNMIRVPDATHQALRQMAHQSGESMQNLLVEAVEAMRRRRMLEETNAAYAAMHANPHAWQEELDERAAWDATLSDGLEREE